MTDNYLSFTVEIVPPRESNLGLVFIEIIASDPFMFPGVHPTKQSITNNFYA
jgi:hypothetical protein